MMRHRKTNPMVHSSIRKPDLSSRRTNTPSLATQSSVHRLLPLLVLVGMLAAIGLAGCQSSPAATPTAVPVTPTAALTAVPPQTAAETDQPVEAAAKGTADNPLIQLLVPSGKVDQILAGVHELDALMEAQGVTLNSSIAVSYAAAIDALCSGQADIVWMAPLSYVVAKDKCPESQLLFTSLRFGSKAYNGQILVGADSGIDKLEDLAGKTIAFTDPASASGYLYPIALLEERGVKPGRTFFAGSHPAAALAVVRGEADAAATVADIRNELEQEIPDIKQTTRVLAQTEDIPNDTIAASPNVSPESVASYKKALLDVTSSKAGEKALDAIYGWEGVAEGDDTMFEPVRQAVTALGIDLQDWKGVTKPYRIGLVTDGGNVEDGTHNQSAYEGMMRAAGDFNVETALVETVQATDYDRNLELFAKQGYDLVISIGPEMGDVTRSIAEKYPATRFAIVDHSYETYPANLKGLVFREDEAGFLAGALAGLMSKTKTVGLVAGEESPAAKQFRAAYENGVTCVCPGCDVIGVYVNTATDPIQGKTAALGQIGEGADVVTGIGGPVGVGAIQGAAQDDVWAIGAEQDQYVTAFDRGQGEGAKRLLSSALKRGDEAVYDTIKSLVGGAFAGGTAVYGVGNMGITLAPFHDTEADVTDEVKAMLEQIETALAQGTLKTGINPVNG